jgi:hypothetical protein
VDADGDQDLMVATFYSTSVDLLLNDGVGGLGTQRGQVPVGDQPSSLATGDGDGNGAVDVVAGNSGDATATRAICWWSWLSGSSSGSISCA